MKDQSIVFSSQLYLPLASPIADGAPCGPALEYTSEFIELESLLQGTPEQQYGDTVIAGEGPDWRDILKRSLDLLSHTRDLRLAAVATRASVECHGLSALPSGLDFIATLLEEYWESVHPELEDGDSTFRQNALSGLNDHSFLLKTLRNTTVLESRGIPDILISDLEKLYQGTPVGNLTRSDLALRLKNQQEQANQLTNTIQHCIAACLRIDTVIAERAQAAQFTEDLQRLLGLVQTYLPTAPEAATECSAPSNTGVRDGTVPSTFNAPRTIRDRSDISTLIDQMCRYLETHEPGNPAPLLLRRAQKLLGMDFLSIIRELHPDSIRSIEQLAGISSD